MSFLIFSHNFNSFEKMEEVYAHLIHALFRKARHFYIF